MDVPIAGSEGRAVEYGLLGGFRASHDGNVIPVAAGPARVVAFLALAPHRRAHRERVAGCLWPDATRSRSLANLRSALWRMPDPVRASVLTDDPNHMALSGQVPVDIDLLTRERGQLPAVQSIVGELLSGWYDDWIVAERERLELLRIAALERIATEHLVAGECASAIDVALIAIGADPYRESLHRIVIVAHTAEGNQSEAIWHYRRLCCILDEGLGARPSDATMRLVAELSANLV